MKRNCCTTVGALEGGCELTSWLARRFTYFGLEEWKARIRAGDVTVNGELGEPEAAVASGDLVRFDPSSIEEPEVDASFSIVMEDEDFLVLDKSSDLPCHPGGVYFEHSLWYILRSTYPDVRIATRLDRETSGLVLACKNRSAARLAEGMLARRSIEKEYLALVHGDFCAASGMGATILAEGYLAPDGKSIIRKKLLYREGPVPPGTGPALSCSTRFEPLAKAMTDRGEVSLVKAYPRTGRTHQIRATLLGLGYPIVGDKLYGLDEDIFLRFARGQLDEADRERLMMPSQALHCSSLRFAVKNGEVRTLRSRPRWGYPFTLFDQLPDLM